MKQTSQPFAALDLAIRRTDFIARRDDAVPQSLMIPLDVEMFEELLDRIAQRRLAEQDEPSKTFLFQ